MNRAPRGEPPAEHELRVHALRRIAQLAPDLAPRAVSVLIALGGDDEEILFELPDDPPAAPRAGFSVARVLRDLVE